jgi:dUTPase
MTEEKIKSFAINKQMVYDSYLRVCENKGSAGVDNKALKTSMKSETRTCIKFGIGCRLVVILQLRYGE